MGNPAIWPSIRTVLVVVFVLGLFAGAAEADDAAPTFDLNGVWKYETGKYWNQGACPPGRRSRGECKITQNGNAFTLVFTSGMTCQPESMCTFTGKITGAKCDASNSAQVDNEGGVAKNRLVLVMESKARGRVRASPNTSIPAGFSANGERP